MITHPNTSTATTSEELRSLLTAAIRPDDNVAIVAGHFMLMYEPTLDELVPMIHEDATTDYAKRFSKSLAGAFPTQTFNEGIQLWQSVTESGASAKVVLAVNDHAFRAAGFQFDMTSKLAPGSVAEKRSSFYRSHVEPPPAFKRLLEKMQLRPEDVIFNNDNLNRPDDSILPRKSLYFSEKQLRNVFDRRTLKAIRDNPVFRYTSMPTPDNAANYKLDYINSQNGSEVCLTEDGSCGCSGEVIQFFLQLQERSFNRIIFFVPQECELQVIRGTEATLAHINHSLNIHLVFGFGGMAGNPPKIPQTFQVISPS